MKKNKLKELAGVFVVLLGGIHTVFANLPPSPPLGYTQPSPMMSLIGGLVSLLVLPALVIFLISQIFFIVYVLRNLIKVYITKSVYLIGVSKFLVPLFSLLYIFSTIIILLLALVRFV